jgi:YVTN family beta-propeller protein
MRTLHLTAALTLLISGFCASIQANAQSKEHIKLLHTYKVQGNGGWDYLTTDHQSNRLYISHATQVNVLNEKTGDSVGLIPNTPGVHGICLVSSLNKGYISNGKTGTCTVFNKTTLAATGEINVGENPDAIFYDDYSKKVFVFNGHSIDVSIIDPAKDIVVATLALGGKPETGVSDGKGNIYVNIEDKNEVVCFSANHPKILKRYPLKNGEEPSGLAIDRVNDILFVGCGNKVLLVLDALSGKTISKIPIGEGCDGVAYDPLLKQIYSSNGEGTLTVIKELGNKKFKLLESVKTAVGARTLAVDQISHHIFLSTAVFKPGTIQGKRAPLVNGSFKVMEFGY